MKKLYAALSIVLMLAAAVAVQPAYAVIVEPGQQPEQSKSLSVPMAEISTPLYPVGINSGESKLVEYSLSETNNISGEITGRTLQFFTQYDDPLSEPLGPYPTSIAIDALSTTSWNELVYLPNSVVEKARTLDEYAVVLKTKFTGESTSGARFETNARLLLLLQPAFFTKRAPDNGADLLPVNLLLNWSSSVGAIDYEYCFDTVDNNRCDTNWTGTYWPSTYDTKVVLEDLPFGTTFYWQVRANNAAGQTYANEGNWWSFTTCEQDHIVVTNINDSGPGSLRQAIEDVCTGGKITFEPSLSGQTITLASRLEIKRDLTLDASTLASSLIISGNNSVSVMQVEPDITVTLNHLTLKDAFSSWGALTNLGNLTLVNSTISDSVSDYYGGAISNFGTLNIQNGSIVNNSAAENGGGIYNEGTLTLTNTLISNNGANNGGGINTINGILKITGGILSNNSAVTQGGAVYNFGTASVKDTTFTGNSSNHSGGAIYHSYSGMFTVESSTFTNNSSSSLGGGIYNDEDQLEIRNSTFFGNTADFGGAIYNNGSVFAAATLTLKNNTFSENEAIQGGGVYNAGTLVLSNSILANSVTGADCHNVSGVVNSNGNNLIETNGTAPENCDIPALSLDPRLAPLGDHGGLTQTMSLLAGSPAIDAGDDATCTTTDQRGYPRLQGPHCDIGAFEVAVTPVLFDPAAGEHVLSLRPTFDWHDLENAIEYRVQISRNNSFTNLLKTVTVQESRYVPNFNLPVNKKLFWRVRARTASGLTDWSEMRSFSTPNPPARPILVSPVLNALNTNYTPLFKWESASLPTGTQFKHYQLQVDDQSDFSSPEIDDSSITHRLKPQFQVTTPLAPNKRYYWRVRVVNTANELSSWSTIWYFRSAMLPPDLFAPTDTEQVFDVRPIFSWDSTEGATKYQVVVSRYENMSSPLVSEIVSGLNYRPTINLPANKTLYWRVRALGANGPSRWSVKWSFLTGSPPSIPVLVAPNNGALIRNYTPTFDWSNAKVPTGTAFKTYEIEVDDDKDFSSSVIHAYTELNDGSDSRYTHDIALDPNTRYYWRVRAIGSLNGNDHFSAWSPVWSVRTAVLPPTLLSPANLSTNVAPKPTFSWQAVDGASKYTIQASTTPGFASLNINATTTALSYTSTIKLPVNKLIYWRVRANGQNGPSAWSEVWSFHVPLLAAPAIVAPTHGASLRIPVELQWNAVPRATKYQIRYAPSGSDAYITQPAQTDLRFTLYERNHWDWQVRAGDSLGNWSEWSTPASFEALPGPFSAIPAITFPSSGTTIDTLKPQIKWTIPLHAGGWQYGDDQYRIQFDNNDDFSSPEYDSLHTSYGYEGDLPDRLGVDTLKQKDWLPSLGDQMDIPPDGTYAVRVQGVTSDGLTSEWSTPITLNLQLSYSSCSPASDGLQVYNFSWGPYTENNPKLMSLTISDQLPDQNETVDVSVNMVVEPFQTEPAPPLDPIRSLVLYMYTDHQVSAPITLTLMSGTDTNGTWQGQWTPEDTFCFRYRYLFEATNDAATLPFDIVIRDGD